MADQRHRAGHGSGGNPEGRQTFYETDGRYGRDGAWRQPMPENASQTELDERIALLRRNIAELMEQATGASGAAVEEALADRLSEQQDMLNELLKQREAKG